MGVGKSTIGRKLAARLSRRFVDSDEQIESKTGVDIDLIFELEGEAGFRKREEKTINDLTKENNIVLATGGGAVLSAENRKNLSERGIVIYLKASPEILLKRTSKDNKRPLLQTDDRFKKICELVELREPYYLDISSAVVDTGVSPTKQIIDTICEKLKN